MASGTSTLKSQTSVVSAKSGSSTLRTSVLILLPILSIIGAFGTWVLGSANGSFDTIKGLLAKSSPFLPGSQDVMLQTYTGIGPVDEQLQILITFFAPAVDGSNIELMLFCIFGAGQFGSAWTLLMMESLRAGNNWRIVSFIGTFGILIQNLTFTITVPLYLALHLLTSPVAKLFPGNPNSSLLIPKLDLKILPFSVILGYVIPTILMILPSPNIVSPVSHQRFIAFWQAFPLWSVITHWTIRTLVGTISKSDSSKNAATPGAAYLSTANRIYTFVFAFGVITHVPVLAITLLPASILPKSALFNSTFTGVFVPYLPLLTHKVPFDIGVLTFLQWDIYTGSTALILWAVLLHRNATTAIDLGTLVGKIAVWTLLSGPAGAVAILLSQRDAILTRKIKKGQ